MSRSRFERLALALSLTAALGLGACAVPVTRTVRVVEPPPAPVVMAPAPPPVVVYGTVSRIEEVDTRVGDSGGGAVVGGIVGGVIGNQFGHGAGRAAATALGIFGGAVVGDNVERANAAGASHRIYHVYVQFDDGSERRFDYRGLDGLRAGERVRLERGVLQRG